MARTKITHNQIETKAATASIATAQGTSSTSYADLATVGPEVTVDVGNSGMLEVVISAFAESTTVNSRGHMSFALSGANTLAASDGNCVLIRQYTASLGNGGEVTTLLTGLNPGATTVTAKYKTNSGTMVFGNALQSRKIIAKAL